MRGLILPLVARRGIAGYATSRLYDVFSAGWCVRNWWWLSCLAVAAHRQECLVWRARLNASGALWRAPDLAASAFLGVCMLPTAVSSLSFRFSGAGRLMASRLIGSTTSARGLTRIGGAIMMYGLGDHRKTLTFLSTQTYFLPIMRFFMYGLILTLLCTALHGLVDHRLEGQQAFALFSHPGPSHLHFMAFPPDVVDSHDHAGAPAREHNPTHHATDTHQHDTWSTPTSVTSVLDGTPGLLKAGMLVTLALAETSAALYGLPPEPPPRGLPLYLQCSTLRI